MLETFRKYTGLMFVVLILLFIGLVFFGSSQQSLLSGPKVLNAYGRGYTQQEFNRLASNPARMLRELAGDFYSPRYQAVDPYLRRMGVMTYNRFALTEDQLTSYLVNRVALQKAMKEFGVASSTAEVEQFLKETIFWADGKFDEASYSEFVQKTLPKLGMTVKDMNEVIGEILAIEKLSAIMGSGVQASREAVLARHLATSQRASYQLVSFPLSDFEAAQNPSEEDIKKQWEENRGKYLSESKRRVTYILAGPDFEALKKKKQEEAKQAAGESPEGEAEEGADTKPDDPTADPSKDEELTTQERERAVIEVAQQLDLMADELADRVGEGFEQLAAKYGFEVKTTELIEKSALPAELTGTLRDDPEQTAADLIFTHETGENLLDATSEIKRVGDQWFIFRLDEVVDPRELDLEEAREAVRLDLVKERAMEAMKKAAEEKHAALQEALESGKAFAEAAQELELKPVARQDLTRPGGRTATPAAAEFDLAAKTNPGELSEVVTEESTEENPARSFFVFLDKREAYENPNLETVIDSQLEQAQERNQDLVLDNWLALQRADADLKFPKP